MNKKYYFFSIVVFCLLCSSVKAYAGDGTFINLSLIHISRSCRRAWIGKDGKDEGTDGSGNGEEDEIVYVGRGSTRYHRDRGCHYLSNSLTSVPYDSVGEQRNDSGKKYHACSVCGSGAGAGGTVYIMPSGTSFHTTKNCTAIIAYVKAVHLSEVSYLGPCSYCSR